MSTESCHFGIGEILLMDTASLFIAGASANEGWILHTLAGLVGAAIFTAFSRRRMRASK